MPNSFTPEEISQIIEEFFNVVGTRQYIGARYVPIFGRRGEDSIQWDNTAPYEPLTIVLYQGDSYTSRQYVPEGVDITNELFWALTGNYNAQIEAYRREVQGFSDRIDAIEESDITQSGQLAGTTASGLKDLITANTGHLTDVDDQLAGTTASGLKGLIDENTTDITQTNQRLDSFIDSLTPTPFGFNLAPTYVGDFMVDYQHSCCMRIGNNIHVFLPSNWTDSGEVRVFNLEANALVNTYQVRLGHANSCAYDVARNRIYVAPLHQYDGNGNILSYPKEIISYAPNYTDMVVIPIRDADNVYGVSYDAVTNITYAMSCSSVDGPVTIYAMQPEASTFTEIGTLSANDLTYVESPDNAWQDFAVYNNVLIVTKTEGTCYCYDLKKKNSDDEFELFNTARIGMYDAGGMWKYGEIEGIEFDAAGRLYNARNALCGVTNTGAHHQLNFGVVTELNTSKTAMPTEMSAQTLYGTRTLLNNTEKASKFTLGRSELRALSQINWLQVPFAAVTLPEGSTHTTQRERIAGKIFTLSIAGTLNIDSITMGGQLDIIVQATGVINGSGSVLVESNNMPMHLGLRNLGTINLPNAQRFVRTGYTPSLIACSGIGTVTGDNAHKFNDVTATTQSFLFMANNRVWESAS